MYPRIVFLVLLQFTGFSALSQLDSALHTVNDSTQQKLQAFYKKEKIDSLSKVFRKSITLSKDSLQFSKGKLTRDSLQLDSLQHWYRQQQSKIMGLPSSQKKKKQQLDSIQQVLKQKQAPLIEKQQKHVAQAKEKQEALQENIAVWSDKWKSLLRPIDSLGINSSSKVDRADANSDHGLGAVGIPARDVTLPEAGTSDVTLPALGGSLPSINPTVSSAIDLELLSADVPPLEGNLLAIPKAEMPDLDIPEIKEIQDNLSELKSLSKEVKAYSKSLDSLDREAAQKKLESTIENRVGDIKEVQELKENVGLPKGKIDKIREYEKMARQYQDKAVIQKQMEQKSKNVATDFLKDKAPQVQAAQSKLAKSQKKYRQFSSLTDAKKHPWNSLKGIPFKDRFLPGFVWQFQKSEYQDVFLSSGGTYKITGRVAIGFSGTYRLQMQTKPSLSWMSGMQTYGPRLTGRVGLIKGIFIHTEWEKLSSIYEDINTKERSPREWSDRVMVGIGKSFMLSRRIKGETLLLYNLQHKKDNVYNNQVNLRTGFYLKRKN